MARMLLYERPVDVIDVGPSQCTPSWSGTLLKIKEEPNNDDEAADLFSDNSNSLVSTKNTSASLKVGDSKSDVVINTNKAKRLNILKRKRSRLAANDGQFYRSNVRSNNYKRTKGGRNNKTARSTAPTNTKSQIAHTKVTCEICFLTFSSEARLKHHYKHYYTAREVSCDTCNLHMRSRKLAATHFRSTHSDNKFSGRYRFQCHFCEQQFCSKPPLQAHIFHFHNDRICSKNKTPSQKIQNIESAESSEKPESQQTGNISVPSPRANSSPTVKLSSEVVESEKINNERKNGSSSASPLKNSPSPKKLRQTTLTEFMCVDNREHKKEPISPSKIQEDAAQEEQPPSNENCKANHTPSTDRNKIPFVHIHLPLTEYLPPSSGCLGSKEITNYRTVRRRNGSLEQRHVRRSLRLNTSDYDPQVNLEKRRQRIQRSLRSLYPKNTDSVLRRQYKCKDCYVRLVRCDTERNHVMRSNSAAVLPKRPNTPFSAPRLSKNGNLIFKEVAVCLEKMPVTLVEGKLNTPKSEVSAETFTTESFTCKVCDEEFSSKEERKQHVKATHTAYMSSICNARYSLKHKLIEHYLRQHYLFKRNECCVCGEPCSDRIALRRHLILHCIKVIQSKDDTSPLNIDVICKSYQKTNKCMTCGKSFWLLSCLKQHQAHCRKRKENNNGPIKNDNREKKTKFPTIKLIETDNNHAVALPESTQSQTSFSTSQQHPVSSTHLKDKQVVSINNPQIDVQNMDPNTLVPPPCHSEQSVDLVPPIGSQLTPLSTGTTKASAVKPKYSCDICGKKYLMYQNLQRHLRMYTKLTSALCEVCGTVFGSTKLLQAHYNTTHMPVSYSYKYHCSVCYQGFAKKDPLRVHQLHLHPQLLPAPEGDRRRQVSSMCNVCNLVFDTYARFVEHNMYYSKDQVFSCAFCGKVFGGMYLLHHHNKLDHYPEYARTAYNYTCDTCGEGFKHQSHFYAHKVHVHLMNPTSTEELSKQSSDARLLNNIEGSNCDKLGVMTNSGKTLYTCKICNAQFNSSIALRYHESEFADNGVFKCEQCPRKCWTSVLLTKHQVLSHGAHENDRKYVCRICKEVLTSEDALASHEKHLHNQSNVQIIGNSNTMNVVNKCGICALDFPTCVELMNHVDEYANTGDHICELCHRKFREPQHLHNHKEAHKRLGASSTRYKCSACNQQLLSAVDVHAHIIHLHTLTSDLQSVSAKKTMGTHLNRIVQNDHTYGVIHSPLLIHADHNLAEAVRPSIVNPRANIDQVDNTVSTSNLTNPPVRVAEVSKVVVESVTPNLLPEKKANPRSESKLTIIPTPKPNVSEPANDKAVKCNVCNLKFANKKNLIRHWVRFVNKGNYVCEFCGKVFPWESCFKDHRRKHLEAVGMTLKYSCHICGEKFRTAASAHAHVTHYHNKRESPFVEFLEVDKRTLDQQVDQVYFQTESGEVQVSVIRSDGTIEDIDAFANQTDTYEIQILDEESNQSNGVSTANEKPQRQASVGGTPKPTDDVIHIEQPGAYGNTSQLDNYTCPVCLQTYQHLLDFQTHFRNTHPKQLVKYPNYRASENGKGDVPFTEQQGNNIGCVVCSAVFSNEMSFKKHLDSIHMPRTVITNNVKKRHIRIIRKILVSPHQCAPQAAWKVPESNNDKQSKVGNNNSSNSTHLKKSDVSANVAIPKDKNQRSTQEIVRGDQVSTVEVNVTDKSEITKPQNSNVGKLKVKDFAKLIQMEDQPTRTSKKKTIPTTPKYVLLQPDVPSNSFLGVYVDTLRNNGNEML